ncbi:MAG TPA: YegP family protein [Burkholderiales bacterium]
MNGSFELKRSKSNDYYFVLKAENGNVILTSEMYKTKDSAENGIASVQKNCVLDERYARATSAANGKFRFNLTAANHQVIGTSELYETEATREAGIASVKRNGKSTNVKDST